MTNMDELIDKTTDVGALSGGGLAALGILSFNEWLGAAGLILAVASFGVNLWHKRQMVRIAREAMERERHD